ncbi:MAG: multidrug efflux SMR transporter [Rhodobacteraceae bacterium]|nr:multidrug efflux SMR transporter [Paracoccaceae bacterium]
MAKAYLFLVIAIAAETVGTVALQASHQFSRLLPSILVVVSYVISFYFMALVLRYMPVGIVYAIWSGLGIVFIATIGYFAFGQRLDAPAFIGLTLILAGILIIHLFSTSAMH